MGGWRLGSALRNDNHNWRQSRAQPSGTRDRGQHPQCHTGLALERNRIKLLGRTGWAGPGGVEEAHIPFSPYVPTLEKLHSCPRRAAAHTRNTDCGTSTAAANTTHLSGCPQQTSGVFTPHKRRSRRKRKEGEERPECRPREFAVLMKHPPPLH